MNLLGLKSNDFEMRQTSKGTSKDANLILFEQVIPDTMKA